MTHHPPPPLPLAMHEIHVSVVSAEDASRGLAEANWLLALWSARGALPRLYGEVLEVWRPWARAVTGRGLAASHFLVEDRPHEVVDELSTFLLPRASTHPDPDPPGGPDVA